MSEPSVKQVDVSDQPDQVRDVADEEGVHFCLLSEFDIDAGATLAHQYPYPTGTDEHRLAELMLPDGAHHRAEDWTIFYLGQSSSNAIAPILLHEHAQHEDVQINRQVVDGQSGGRKGSSREAGLLYVLNCVRMKEDKSMRRGAMVKALAICTPNPYIDIYKPLLLLALEEYFSDPSPMVLGRLFDSANAISTLGMPSLSRDQRIILRTSERKDLFDDEFGVSNEQQQEVFSDEEKSIRSPGHSEDHKRLSFDTSRSPPTPDGERASITRQHSTSSAGHLPIQALGSKADPFGLGQSGEPHTVSLSKHSSHRGTALGRPKDTHFFDTTALYRQISVPIRIPLTAFEEDVGDYSVVQLVQTFAPAQPQPFPTPHFPQLHSSGSLTHPVILILNAMLTHKRVLFLGHGLPANDVARMVLAACAMASGSGQILRGVTETAFPYANLASLDILEELPGYVAGVTNPRFEELPGTWDVLCNLETGKVTVSKEFRGAASSYQASDEPIDASDAQVVDNDANGGAASRVESPDAGFMEEVHAAIHAHFGEMTIRTRFADYLARFVRLAARYEQDIMGSTQLDHPSRSFEAPNRLGSGAVFENESGKRREIAFYKARIDAWRQTRACAYLKQDFGKRIATSSSGYCDLQHQIARLRSASHMSTAEGTAIFTMLATSIVSKSSVTELLSLLPYHLGGLAPVAAGLFHTSAEIRRLTVTLLDNLQHHEIGKCLASNLNVFQRIAYIRLQAELQV